MDKDRIRCNSISYRQGYIEIQANIHPGCINLEAWNVGSEFDIADPDALSALPGEAITGNIELELSVPEAEQLIKALQERIQEVGA